MPENGPQIFKNVLMTFEASPALCALDRMDILAVTFDSITLSLGELQLCELGRAESCRRSGYDALCSTVATETVVPDTVALDTVAPDNNSNNRRRRATGNELELTIRVEADIEPSESVEDVETARNDVDTLAALIQEAARAGNLTMVIDGGRLVSSVGENSTPSETAWQCARGSLVIQDGCGEC